MNTETHSEPQTTWDYRVVHHDTDPDNEWYAIHEIYFQGETVIGATELPVGVIGDTVEGLYLCMSRMRDAMNHPPLRLSELVKFWSEPPQPS